MSKPILCVDFDGVLHSYASGWKGDSIIPDPPVPGALEWLVRVIDVFDVKIYSSRSKSVHGVTAMMTWLDHWGALQLSSIDAKVLRDNVGFPNAKPAAFLTIDDREALLVAAEEVKRHLERAPCDAEAVADCLRCKSFFLAVQVKQMIELLDAEEGR